mmetsp:Transcript_1815/g.5164  ORF Transcript_1815/g.5164 Transcript_1815/m.5164 type:complete len:268 (-) Transcript_1815:59-862(-)
MQISSLPPPAKVACGTDCTALPVGGAEGGCSLLSLRPSLRAAAQARLGSGRASVEDVATEELPSAPPAYSPAPWATKVARGCRTAGRQQPDGRPVGRPGQAPQRGQKLFAGGPGTPPSGRRNVEADHELPRQRVDRGEEVPDLLAAREAAAAAVGEVVHHRATEPAVGAQGAVRPAHADADREPRGRLRGGRLEAPLHLDPAAAAGVVEAALGGVGRDEDLEGLRPEAGDVHPELGRDHGLVAAGEPPRLQRPGDPRAAAAVRLDGH